MSNLTFRALVVLDEVLSGGPVTQGLVLALAYLQQRGADRVSLVTFWQAANREVTGNDASDFGRRQAMNAALNAICRSVGMERTAELERALREARGG